MIRLVGIQRDCDPGAEFLLLQNQGVMRAYLRGLVILSDHSISSPQPTAFVVSDDVHIPPGAFIRLWTGPCSGRWGRTRDGSVVYTTGMGLAAPVWVDVHGPVHVLGIQHTFCERATAATG